MRQLALERRSGGPGLGEARREDDEPARSTGSSRADRDGEAGRPATSVAALFTAATETLERPSSSAWSTPPPTLSGSREAPTTAIEDGRMIGSSDIAAERAKRVMAASSRPSSTDVERRTISSPGAASSSSSQPRLRKTSRMRWLAGSTSAQSPSSPSRRA